MPKQLTDEQITEQAIELVRRDRDEWESGMAYVTERIAFSMRDLIRQVRQNYWGIFNKRLDPVTGRKKIWVPLTESLVEAAVKNIDLDTKDVNFRSKKAESVGLTSLVRSVVKDWLDSVFFGEKLDDWIRSMAIDGTVVVKTLETKDEDGKKTADMRKVDLLNFYIDPVADSISETDSIVERAVMSMDEFMAMTGWINKDEVKARFDIPKVDRFRYGSRSGKKRTPEVEVFERWGKMPKSLITGKEEDKDVVIDGVIVVSNLDNEPLVHRVEKTDGCKPYEEAWYTRVPGRWHGRGVAEKVIMLQLWLNTIVNIRISRSYVSQLGIFKIRKGSGVTPQMVSRLAANGAITVSSMDDIQQFVMQEASQASYADEANIQNWSERVTSVFESVTGESLPSSTPATNAVIQTRTAQSQFLLIKEGFGIFIQRFMKKHLLPILMKRLKPTDVIRVTGEIEELRDLYERLAKEMVLKELEKQEKDGKMVMPEDILREIDRVRETFERRGQDMYVELMEEIDFTEYDVQVFVTNEEIDKAVLVQNLLSVLQTVAAAPGIDIDPAMVVRQIFDVMGLDAAQFRAQQQQLMGVGQPGSPAEVPAAVAGRLPTGQQLPENLQNPTVPSEQGVVTAANTI